MRAPRTHTHKQKHRHAQERARAMSCSMFHSFRSTPAGNTGGCWFPARARPHPQFYGFAIYNKAHGNRKPTNPRLQT